MIQELKSISEIDNKSEKYLDSELYIKERENKLNQFIFELKSKLKLNVNHYSIFESHLLYEYNRLMRNAVAQALLHMIAQHNKLVTIKQLIILLRQVFDNLNKQEITQRFILILKMQNCIFMKYLFNFQ
jgi:RNase P protein component